MSTQEENVEKVIAPVKVVKKGFAFKGATKVVEKLPEKLREKGREVHDVRPEKVASMFGEAAKPVTYTYKRSASSAALPKAKAKATGAMPKATGAMPKATGAMPKEVAVAPTTPFEDAVEAEDAANAPEVPPVKELIKDFDFKEIPVPSTTFDGDLKEMGDLIRAEEKKNPYTDPEGPRAYIPETRRGFSEFIKENYAKFMLKPGAETAPGDKYPYQKFVREYMRNDSPYRGVLTYHGLGSGKTCTAIATAEALYSTANKKIIVMTPFSLRKNFLKEVSLCGFRHFRLANFWVSYPVADQTVRLFATSVLGISEPYLKGVQNIWIPDFRKGNEDANYASLTAEQQTEIRKQILSILVWDEKKNPYGRIRFVNYNGISAKRLQEIACQKPVCEFFDDAVIIVDEIHNLVRLMQGTIDPYLIKVAGLRRLIPVEEITPYHWNPKLCMEGMRTYMRGYLFYRLLLAAKNTKIIGLSGTPLINFPEELGILTNILHGYIPSVELTVTQTGSAAEKKCVEISARFPYTDFVEVKHDTGGMGTKIMVTLLPEGIRKLEDGTGVERIPEEEAALDVDAIMEEFKGALAKADLQVVGTPVAKSLELLPPFGDAFRKRFIKADNSGLNPANKTVLVKRLTGLISYYKGSNEQLMPRVASDEVVRVPMSAYSQHTYMKEREGEVSKEAKKKSGTGELGGVWGEVYEVGGESQTSNYKMASRQACNFTFPSNVMRPKPGKKDQLAEAKKGDKSGDILDVTPDSMEPKGGEEFPEMEEAAAEDAAEAAAAEAEEEAIRDDTYKPAEGEEVLRGGAVEDGKEEDEDEDEDEDDSVVEESTTTLEEVVVPDVILPSTSTTAPKKFVLKGLIAKKAADNEKKCETGQQPGEKYTDAVQRSKHCLETIARDKMKLGAEGLSLYSPKFAAMLTKIEEIATDRGSSLVYSQFLDMEGIGIFKIAMDVNGYAPIEIIKTSTGLDFSTRTKESLKKGPGAQPRYITFSGGEEDDVRRLCLDIFNANFNELPADIKSLLVDEMKYTDNKTGQLCRVFCITSAGAEGISLKNVRAVHIMEPYWNDVRLRQVKGRAIRIGSHLELEESERNVAIYTYLSVFSETAQAATEGDMRIDPTIRQYDRVERKDALEFGLPISDRATEYIITTDERLYIIAERKKIILNALESVMKSAAVDCELNIQENKDGSFKCLPLRGKVGDFMYHPKLDEDIRESASKYAVGAEAEPVVAPVPAAPAPAAPKPTGPPAYIMQDFKGKRYRMKYVRLDPKAVATGFEMYAEDDVAMKTMLGKSGVKLPTEFGKEKPGKPVEFF